MVARSATGRGSLFQFRRQLVEQLHILRLGATPKGLFIFHSDGHTSVQIVNPERPATGPDRAADDDVRALADRGCLVLLNSTTEEAGRFCPSCGRASGGAAAGAALQAN